MIKINEDFIKEGITEKLILECIKKYKSDLEGFKRNKEYYLGNHKILNRYKNNDEPNNKIVNNYASYITDTVCGYFMGNSVTISSNSEKDIESLLDTLEKIDIDIHNSDLARDLSVYGMSYEILYINEESKLKIAILDPQNTFVVYSNKISGKSLFAVNFIEELDIDMKNTGYTVNVYTQNEILKYHSKDLDKLELKEVEPHYFDRVPITQFFNNAEGKGDFEGVISQIDAYNILMSDRLNDKEKFVDSILVVQGFSFEDLQKTPQDLKKNKIMEIPYEHSDVKYVTKTLNETEVQVLANALKDDIHKFSHTPDFSDEKFSGNVSGEAMKYKLHSLENLAKVKERFFKTGIRRRLKLILGIFDKKSMATFDLEDIKITMTRTSPANTLELAQMVGSLKDMVSLETLLSQLPFVENPTQELEKLKVEQAESDNNLLDKISKASFKNV